MSTAKTATKYSIIEQLLHWATAVLVLLAFLYGPGGSENRVYAAAGDASRRLHETFGLCVLTLTVVRLCWRAFDVRPDPPVVSRWMGLAAKLVQLALYVLLFGVPLTAITGAWLEGHPITWLLGDIRPLLGESHSTGAQIAELHGWLGDAILWIAGLHALAAIYHHFWLRDGVLLSMLPGRRTG